MKPALADCVSDPELLDIVVLSLDLETGKNMEKFNRGRSTGCVGGTLPEISGRGAQRAREGDRRRATGREGRGWLFERKYFELRDNPQAQNFTAGETSSTQ